jgi:membrane protein
MVLSSGISIILNSSTIFTPEVLHWAPWIVASAVFTWILIAIPNTKVKLSSAIIPGILVGVLFQVFQILSVYLVVLFTRMSVVWGAFSAIPLVLIWLHITCWLLLIGAELAFAIQNNEMFAYERDINSMSRRYKDYVMLYLLSTIIKRFEEGENPETMQEMATKNQLPIRLVGQLLSRLEETGIVYRIQSEQDIEPAFVPALDTKLITVEMVIGRISAQGTEEFLQHTPEEMQAFWQRYQQMIDANHSDDILVSELA